MTNQDKTTDKTTDQTAPKVRRGRPPKQLFVDKRRTHTIRLREHVRQKLMAVSRESGLSMSEEVERRVELTFGIYDRLGALVSNVVRAGEALTGKSWEEDRRTRELTFGLILQRFDSMIDDPTLALLAEDARAAREHFISHAWRAPSNDPFVGMSATHLKSKPEGELAPEPVQEPPQEPVAKSRRKKRSSEPQSEPAV